MQQLRRSGRKTGQIFSTDLILGLVITIAAISSVVLFLPENEVPFTSDAERISVLMSEGVPTDWNDTSVLLPGFLTEGRFNRTKIEAFEGFTYAQQKRLLGLRSDFTIRFSQAGVPLDLCSTCGVAPPYKELLPIQRFAVLESNITQMEVRLYR